MDALIMSMIAERANRKAQGIATALDLQELGELEQLVGENEKSYSLTDLFQTT